jgi:hypothetical protein
MSISAACHRTHPHETLNAAAVAGLLRSSDVMWDGWIALSSERTVVWALPRSRPTKPPWLTGISALCPVSIDENHSGDRQTEPPRGRQ